MDNRFTDIICEVEGFPSPENRRLEALEQLVRSQRYDEHITDTVEEIVGYLYSNIYKEEDDEE